MRQCITEKSRSIQNVATGWMMVDNAEKELGDKHFGGAAKSWKCN